MNSDYPKLFERASWSELDMVIRFCRGRRQVVASVGTLFIPRTEHL